VHVTEAPGAYMSFGGEASNARMARSNLRQYGAILKEMALSDDQRHEAESILREYLDAMRAVQQEHRVELRRAREQAGLGDAPTDVRRQPGAVGADQGPRRRPATDQIPPDAPRPPAAPVRPGADVPQTADAMKTAADARARLEALRQAAPPQEPYMKRLYALLSADQQADFDARMAAMRQAQSEQQLKRRLEAAGIDPQAMQEMEGMKIGPDGGPAIDESQFTPQMRQRLRQMHEQRRRALENRRQGNPAPPTPDDIEFEMPEH